MSCDLLRYQSEAGTEPFTNWLTGVADKKIQAKLRLRLARLATGTFGDCVPVGKGVVELREHIGQGFRMYFGRHGDSVVVLLCGGTKKSQSRDVTLAKQYWADWKRRHP
jgi:putative addiction module killer protein